MIRLDVTEQYCQTCTNFTPSATSRLLVADNKMVDFETIITCSRCDKMLAYLKSKVQEEGVE